MGQVSKLASSDCYKQFCLKETEGEASQLERKKKKKKEKKLHEEIS